MPANASIQVRFQFKFKNRLDSGFRRNDSNSQLPSTNSEPVGLVLRSFVPARFPSVRGSVGTCPHENHISLIQFVALPRS